MCNLLYINLKIIDYCICHWFSLGFKVFPEDGSLISWTYTSPVSTEIDVAINNVRSIRLHPRTYAGGAAGLRFELFGCPLGMHRYLNVSLNIT